ncbi:alpha-N-arabinofuranosidase [Rubrivirga marina]|uniref:non-reducing end alpha-L-arabinofuranosidase n=1 Tax=Rubrivirga marina TaxID=1196024 RepID=A0A271J583_9BACT|nr:alpha-N-arabinofuranosidase [Rubrivirga marina]
MFGLVLLAALAVGASAQDAAHRMVLTLDAEGPTINRHLFGHFAEHLGRGIYGGFWTEGADGWELNAPVVEAMRALDPPNVRWPGGCFADVYHWRDGVGPARERPTIVNTLWGGVTEDNGVGTHEFVALAEALGAEPIVVGNVGSGTVREMADWWQYVNHPGPSPMADLRAENGHPEPWGVRFWGVGNESWGCGGNMSPEHYADLYKRYATFLHGYGDVRPFRIATGPDATINRDVPEWTEAVMRDAGRMIDGLDMHFYTIVGDWDDRTRATEFGEDRWVGAFARALEMDGHIRRVSAIMDRYDPQGRVWLIVGEWGMWHAPEEGSTPGFLYQQNALRDALVASVTLDVFARHAERVKMANIAQTINVLQAMLLVDGERVVKTPTYHVFDFYKAHQDAERLPFTLDAGTYAFGGQSVPAVSATASRDETGHVHVTLTNLDPHRARTVSAEMRGGRLSRVSGRVLTASEMTAHNTFEDPDVVVPAPFGGVRLDGQTLTVTLPPMSVVALDLQ